MAIIPRNDALAEIEERLTAIYNEMRFLREENAGLDKQRAANADRLAVLDRISTDYVALLVPKQEGIPA